MKKILLLLIILTFNLNAADSLKNVVIANINKSPNINMNNSEIIKATDFALRLSGKYRIVTNQELDSAKQMIKKNPLLNPGPINTAIETGSDEILFLGVNRFENILRVDAAFVNVQDTNIQKLGFGYQMMNYRDVETEQPLAQPSFTNAAQRAFTMALDSNLYENVEEDKYQVVPAETVVIGGLKYVDSDSLEEWDIFDKKVLTSYDALEIIFEEASKHNEFVVYDLATRDSIYARFGFYGVENYNAPTSYEVDALKKFQVENIITGQLVRKEKGSELTLYLIDITNENYEIIREEKTLVLQDSKEGFRNTIRFLTDKLLFDL
jgi:hypothetical protein